MNVLRIYGFLPESKLLTEVAEVICDRTSPFVELCADFLFILCGIDSEQFNRVMHMTINYVLFDMLLLL